MDDATYSSKYIISLQKATEVVQAFASGGSSSERVAALKACIDPSSWIDSALVNKAKYWEQMKQTRFIDTLLQLLSEPLNLGDAAQIASCCVILSLISKVLESDFMEQSPSDPVAQQLIRLHGPVVFRNCSQLHMKAKLVWEDDATFGCTLLRLLHSWLSHNKDAVFMSSFGDEYVWEYLHYVQFDPNCQLTRMTPDPAIEDADFTQLKAMGLQATGSLYGILLVYHLVQTSKVLNYQKIPRDAFSRYGPATIINRLHYLLTHDGFRNWHICWGTIYTVRHFLQLRDVIDIFYENRVALLMLKRYWECCRAPPSPQIDAPSLPLNTGVVLLDALAVACFPGETRTQMLCREMILERDLILFLGKALSIASDVLEADFRRDPFFAGILEILKMDTAVRRHERVKKALFHVLQIMKTDPKSSPRLHEFWDTFIRAVYGASLEDFMEHHAPSGPNIGCAWFKCPNYRDPVVVRNRIMLLCTRCHSVQYCGRSCQQRHWKARHKSDCNSS